MRERPADISDGEVAAALARHWPLTAADLRYLPVGFGGYHWLAVDQTGSRWFVTVSDLAAPWVPDLPAAMQTAAWLAAEAGLGFVVAPVPTRAGQVVGSLDGRHALTLFPYLDAAAGHFGDPIDDGDRAALIDLLAALHTAVPQGIQVPGRPLELASLHVIDDALAGLDVPWPGGPYAEPGRDLVARHERPLRRALARFDGLIDWDMTALARPERDPWWVISDERDAARYSRRTGRTVSQDALALYRLRWGLDDLAEFLSEIRGPHQRTADTLVSWTALRETLESLAKGLDATVHR